MAQQHQLAAIMFTDIVGYSTLMGSDEARAMEVLKTNREIHKRIIQQYKGKWLKEMGDGVLASFKTASEAAYCAGTLLNESKTNDITLRIGIHMGEIIEEDGDIFGDGVNVASRLEPLAEAGTIIVSDPVYQSVKNKSGIECRFIDEKKLKNVDDPLRIYRLNVLETRSTMSNKQSGKIPRRIISVTVAALVFILFLYGLSGYLKTSKTNVVSNVDKSIAVLPFNNLSTDDENQYFADGLVEDLLNRLAMIEEFKVISRTSSDTYRERGKKNLPQIASELGVSYIVEGSVQKHGNKARITVQLIDAKNDDHIWFETFDRDLTDIFEIQSEIAVQVASGLSAVLTEEQISEISKSATDNPRAFELYQLGRFYWNKRTQEGHRTAINYFEQAIEEDPDYALAYAGLSDANFLLIFHYGNNEEARKYREKAEELARKVLEMDKRVAEAYNVLGGIYSFLDWDWAKAERQFLQGLEYNPNHPNLHHRYSEHLMETGRPDEARRHINIAMELDPLSFVIRTISAHIYYAMGFVDEAMAEVEVCHQLIPDKSHPRIIDLSFELYYHLGNDRALLANIKSWDSIRLKGKHHPTAWDSIYQVSGLDDLVIRKAERVKRSLQKAFLYALVGEDDLALEYLGQDRVNGYIFDYSFRRYHNDPRYIAILEKSGLPWKPD